MKNASPLNRHHQKGITLLGLLIVGSFVVLMAIVGMKIVPAYIDHASVISAMKSLKQERLNDMSKQEIITAFDKRADTSYIEVVKGSDLSISKNDEGGTSVSVDYQVITPIFGNLSALIDFSASTDSE
ncbi:MAG: DUF4845 domain-containing protein [Methylotenera sp.]|nr:DUF4845 domain-containing protein [Methylotenera sp.]